MGFVKISVGPTSAYAIQDMKWIQLEKTVLVRSSTCFLRHFIDHAFFFLIVARRKLLLSSFTTEQMHDLYFGCQHDTCMSWLTKIYIAESRWFVSCHVFTPKPRSFLDVENTDCEPLCCVYKSIPIFTKRSNSCPSHLLDLIKKTQLIFSNNCSLLSLANTTFYALPSLNEGTSQ